MNGTDEVVTDMRSPSRDSDPPDRRHDRTAPSPGSVSAPSRSGWRETALATALFALLTVAMTWPQAAQPLRVADQGDPLFSIWRLAWVAHQLPRDPAHLFDANIFYPERNTLAYSDAMLVPGVAAAPLFWTGLHPVRAYTLVLLAAFAFSGAAMFVLVRALTGSRGAAVVSGIAFAFCPFRFDHYSHLELQVAMWMPLGLLALHRLIDGGRLRAGLAAGGAVALQALSSLYYGVFFVCFLAPVTIVLGSRRRSMRQWFTPLAAGAALAAVLVLPVLPPYLQARRVVGTRSQADVAAGSATLRSFAVAPERLAVYRGLLTDASEATGERRLFPGVLTVLLALVALWPPVSRPRLAYAAGLAVAADLSLGLNGILYPALYRWVLPFEGLRVPARMGIVVGLAVAVLAGYGVARVLDRLPRSGWRRAAAATALAAALLFELHPVIDLETVWLRPPTVYGWFRGKPPAVIMEVPSQSDATGPVAEMKYVYFSVFHWQKLLVGNSGFFPPSHDELTRVMRSFPDEASLAYLRRRGVNYLIMHGAFGDPGPFLAAADWLDRQTGARLIGRYPWEGSVSWLYELAPPDR